MKQLSLNEIKIIQLNILKEVDKFCRDNNIVYYLTHGTLLGAVKYKGYIPWDDDADIAMPKPYYDKFISLFNKSQSVYRVKDYSIDKKFPYTYAKIEHIQTSSKESTSIKFELGVNVDLFPLGGVPDDQLNLRKHFFNINLYDYLLSIKKAKLSPKWTFFRMLILKILLVPFSYCFFVKKVFKLKSLYNYHDSKLVIDYSKLEQKGLLRLLFEKIKHTEKYHFLSSNKVADSFKKQQRGVYPKNIFKSTVELEFENHLFKAPVYYDEYLKRTYGNYTQNPSIEKQVTHHNFTAYWK